MLKISEFSRICMVSVKTLRYYDEIGLLPPAEVDQWTKYRYYSAEQLPRLRRIIMLKGMGFSLVEIGRILNEDLTADQIADIARLKRAELNEQLNQQQAQLVQLDYWLDQLAQEHKMSDYTVSIKEVQPVSVCYTRSIIPTQAEIPNYLGPMLGKVFAHAGQHDAVEGTCIAEYYDQEFTGKDMDTGAAAVLTKEIPAGDGVEIRELDSGMVAFTTHLGPYRFLTNAFVAVSRWIGANGYRICGQSREVYLSGDADGDQEDCVTEVMFFVEKM